MKINTLILVFLGVSLLGLSLCNTETSENKNMASKIFCLFFLFLEADVLGGNSNFSGKNNSAITYGLADVGAYSYPQQELAKLKSPSFLPKLPEKFDIPRAGPLENVEEIPSSTDYYDGSTNLNKKKMVCKIYGNASDCLKNSSCGWCGSNNSCILGNNLGPLQSCKKSSFLYSSPLPNWNYTAAVENNGADGVKFTLHNN